MERWTPLMPREVGSYLTSSRRSRSGPELLEDVGQVLHEPGVAEFQGDLVVVAGRDEGDGPVEHDQTADELFERAYFHVVVGHAFRVRECAGAVARGVLVEGAHADAAVDHGQTAFQRLAETVLGPAAAGLDGEHFGAALCGGEVEGRVDPVRAFQHGDGVGAGRPQGADVHERLERLRQFDRVPAPFQDLALYGMQMLRESGGRRNGPEPVRVVRIGMQ